MFRHFLAQEMPNTRLRAPRIRVRFMRWLHLQAKPGDARFLPTEHVHERH
jgi:hypothetical protein